MGDIFYDFGYKDKIRLKPLGPFSLVSRNWWVPIFKEIKRSKGEIRRVTLILPS